MYLSNKAAELLTSVRLLTKAQMSFDSAQDREPVERQGGAPSSGYPVRWVNTYWRYVAASPPISDGYPAGQRGRWAFLSSLPGKNAPRRVPTPTGGAKSCILAQRHGPVKGLSWDTELAANSRRGALGNKDPSARSVGFRGGYALLPPYRLLCFRRFPLCFPSEPT
jgi:hypothetical protein